MAAGFTYTGDPSASELQEVRFYTGDTNRNRPLLHDKEILFAISKYPNPLIAAAVLCEHLMGRFASEADVRVGEVSKSFSKISEAFKKKADQLRTEAASGATVSFPATRHSTKDPLDEDEDLTRPSFAIGMADNPYAVQINEELDRIDFRGFC